MTSGRSAFKKVPIRFGNYKLRYAWVSQRGFYPDEPDKANQDAHVEVENFCSEQVHERPASCSVLRGPDYLVRRALGQLGESVTSHGTKARGGARHSLAVRAQLGSS